MKIVAWVQDPNLHTTVADAASLLEGELILIGGADESSEEQLTDALKTHPDVLLLQGDVVESLPELRAGSREREAALVMICEDDTEVLEAARAGVEEWLRIPIDAPDLADRLRTAAVRTRRDQPAQQSSRVAEYLRYEELLYDRFTGFPTLPVMIERGREMLEREGRITILYIEFVRYSKLEEIYGWQKLDGVLQTTANAVREFHDRQRGQEENLLMVSHAGDDDFIFITDIHGSADETEMRVNEIGEQLEADLAERLEAEHGEDIAGLFAIYVGSATVFRNPKVRAERSIYRGIREAASAARSVENRERSRKVTDLKTTLREGAVYIEYHPIVVAATDEVYGYEALARGSLQGLRSPEVLFGVAEEANLIWELSRLCRRRAIEGMTANLEPHQLLFLNIDPHDFRDPTFRYLDVKELGIDDPERIVLEITERIAITDYPAFQEHLRAFREHGFRFAVDDAGSGYAGLGSIANLSPDYIKLDISLISEIDTNFMKQNLVETIVAFAEDHGIKVIAEGVEQQEEYDTVKKLGVHLAQGFLFHQPRYVGERRIEQLVE